jgi:hypothetical protein
MRCKSWGLTEADLKEPFADIIPDRVNKLIELHHKNHIQFPWDQESKNEQIFEYRRTLRPSSYSYNIESIYRIRDPNDKSKEYYFYIKKGKVLNEKDEPEYSNSLTYGYAVEPIHELKYNPKTKRKEPVKIREDPVYFYKWDKKEVSKLLEKSEIPCSNLYIGIGVSKGQGTLGPIKDVKGVKNKEDWLTGDMDTLLLLNKAGIMSPEFSTLNMVSEAKDRFREEQLKRIAAVSSPASSSSSSSSILTPQPEQIR